MDMNEFEKLTGRMLTLADHEIVQTVYTYHPSIDGINGKKQIAELFKLGGMTLINDMLPRAKRVEEANLKINALQSELERARSELDKLSNPQGE